MNKKTKLILLQLLGFIVSVAPLIIGLVIGRERYFGEIKETVKLSFGIVIILTCFAIKAIGKIHLPGSLMLFSIIFILSYLLASVLADLTLLSGLALLGEFLDVIFISTQVKRLKREIQSDSLASAIADKITVPKGDGASGRV